MPERKAKILPFPAGRRSEPAVLEPEEKLSNLVDYADLVAGYDELVAALGEERARDGLDRFHYLLVTSGELVSEREFADLGWQLDPYDYIVYGFYDRYTRMWQEEGTALERAFGPSLEDVDVWHMVADALRRYLTSRMRREVGRRARVLAKRQPETIAAAQADAVRMALNDPRTEPEAIGILVETMRRSLLFALMELPERIEQDWQARDRSLDRSMEALRQADAEHPAEEAVEELRRAGAAALPHLMRLYHDEALRCGDYPLRTALELLGSVPSGQSLFALTEAMADCPEDTRWIAGRLAANMPDRACDYYHYLLSAPSLPAPYLIIVGQWVLVTARCPQAFPVVAGLLHYRSADVEAEEAVQVVAWEALLAIKDREAIPLLREYLRDEQANARSRELLREALNDERGRMWRDEVLPA